MAKEFNTNSIHPEIPMLCTPT